MSEISAKSSHPGSPGSRVRLRILSAVIGDLPKRLFGLAGTALLAVIIAWLVHWVQPTRVEHYETRIGEVRKIHCHRDLITLNTQSTALVQCAGYAAQVWIPRGEASFHVTHDASRPFTVRTPHSEVVDSGTIFSVRVEPKKTTVLVIEGQVRVSALQGTCVNADAGSPDTICNGQTASMGVVVRSRERVLALSSEGTTVLKRA
jgi:transmembrane sensor